MNTKYYISFILFVLCLEAFSCTIEPNPSKFISKESAISPGIEIKVDHGAFLYCTKAPLIVGELKKQGGDYFSWKGNAEIGWSIDVPADQKYDLFMIADVPETSKHIEMIFSSESKILKFNINPTFGPWGNEGKNFQCIKVLSEVLLSKGNQNISLKTTGISAGNILLNIRSVKLVPVSAYPAIEKEKDRAIASRANSEWLIKAGYGVMFHWTSQSINPDGSHKSFKEAVNSFDVAKFANMVEETGAGYVIFTIGHAEQYCPAPIKSWEKCHPGKTTQRDLIGEIATALNAKNIRLICYMHSLGTARFKLDDNKTFLANFKTILNEFGSRYKEKLAGYWFDCWYQIAEGYPDVPFEEFFNATKVGNKDRIITLNSWIYPSVSPWQDYWAGEVASPVAIPENGSMKDGPAPDLRYQALLIMEPYWVQERAEMPDPRFTSSELCQYIRNCNNNGGAVTINLGIYQDGTVGEKALKVMKEVRQQIKTKK